MSGNKRVVLLLLATVVLSAVFGNCSAKSYVVGGSTGWTIPPSASLYTNWASQQKLLVGDVLVFTFPAAIHTVAEVSKSNYDSCTTASTLGPVMTTAPANITLIKPGPHYFICTITGHCSANQKLTVTVSAPSAATPAPQPRLSSPKSSPTPSPLKSSPTPSPSTSHVASPTPTPSPSAATPTLTPTAPTSVPTAASSPEGGSGAASPESPPAGNFAASSGVSLLSLLCIVAVGLML